MNLSDRIQPLSGFFADGRTFESEEEALRHLALKDATARYNEARLALSRLVAETQQTADGHPFRFDGDAQGRGTRYYYLIDRYGAIPRIESIVLYPYVVELDHDDQMTLHVNIGQRSPLTLRIDQLYVSAVAARRAAFQRFFEYLAYNKDLVIEAFAAAGRPDYDAFCALLERLDEDPGAEALVPLT